MEETHSELSIRKWDRFEKLARVLSLVAIPVVIALLGWSFQSRMTEKNVSRDYVNLAITILTNKDPAIDPDIRSWAVDLLSQNAPVKLESDVAARLKAGELILPAVLGAIAESTAGGFDVSPDGKFIAIGMYDHSIRLLESETGRELARLVGHLAPVASVSFFPDNTKLVSGGYDNTIRIWSLKDSVLVMTIIGHTDAVIGVKPSKDGTRLTSRSLDGTVRQWDISNAKEIVRIHVPDF